MKKWSTIYSNNIKKLGGPKKYLDYKIKEKTLLINKIIEYCKPYKNILEAGCGTGVMSTYLANKGFDVTAVDNEQGMLSIARKISKNYTKRPIFVKQDINKLNFPRNHFGVVFSHGVLEHFNDDQIVSLLKQQLKISHTLIFSIPTNYLDEKKNRYYGNERFLSFNKWKYLISKTKCKTIDMFGFHYIMGWRKYLDIIIRGKIFGPSPYLTFVLRKNEYAKRTQKKS